MQQNKIHLNAITVVCLLKDYIETVFQTSDFLTKSQETQNLCVIGVCILIGSIMLLFLKFVLLNQYIIGLMNQISRHEGLLKIGVFSQYSFQKNKGIIIL